MAAFEQFDVTHALEVLRRQSRLSPNELRLLSYITTEALSGRADLLSQKTIAADVFSRDLTTFDPRADSIVRTTAANLRDRLLEYYSTAGRTDPLIIELPKGSYQPRFSRRQQLSAAGSSRLWSARLAMEGRTPTLYKTAIRHLDAVLAESPNLALALALKAEALASWAIHGAEPKPALEAARTLADRALDSDPAVWQASLARGAVASALEWNWPLANEHFSRAIELSGGDADTHPWYTAYLVTQGRPAEAVANLQRRWTITGSATPPAWPISP
jgi:tetratricopeptide (TPR) repeat protein